VTKGNTGMSGGAELLRVQSRKPIPALTTLTFGQVRSDQERGPAQLRGVLDGTLVLLGIQSGEWNERR
jgi:hypothetical protein